MTDEDVRALERAALETDDAGSWHRLATALARLSRLDEAGVAFARAEQRGADCDRDLDALAPSLAELRVVATHDLPAPCRPMTSLAWSHDGRTLHVTTDPELIALDVTSGAITKLEPASSPIAAGESRVAFTRPTSDTTRAVFVRDARGTRQVGGEHGRLDALAVFGPKDEGLLVSTGNEVTGHLEDGAPSLRVRGRHAALGRDGRLVLLRGKGTPSSVAFFDPLKSEPRAVLAFASVGEALHFKMPMWLEPSFLRVVTTGRRALFLSNLAGRVTLVSEAGLVAWMPAVGPIFFTPGSIASPGGRLVCVGALDRRIRLIDVLERGVRAIEVPALESDDSVLAAAWSPSGRRLALASRQRITLIGAE
jgi:hypothetical protein